MKKIILFLAVTVSLFTIGCSDDDNNPTAEPAIEQDYKIDFTTGELQSWVSVSAETTLTYQDNTQETINSNFNYQTHLLSVDVPSNTAKVKVDFYIEDSSPFTMKFYGVENDEVIHQQDVNNMQHFIYEYDFE